MNSGRSLDPEITALVVAWIQRQKKQGVSITEIARKLGVSRTQIYNLLEGSRGAGGVLETKFAELEYGGSVDQLRKAAREAHQKAEVRRTEELPPNLRAAFAAVRGLGPIPELVAKKARDMAAAGGDLPPTVWMAVLAALLDLEDAQAHGSGAQGSRRPRAAS